MSSIATIQQIQECILTIELFTRLLISFFVTDLFRDQRIQNKYLQEVKKDLPGWKMKQDWEFLHEFISPDKSSQWTEYIDFPFGIIFTNCLQGFDKHHRIVFEYRRSKPLVFIKTEPHHDSKPHQITPVFSIATVKTTSWQYVVVLGIPIIVIEALFFSIKSFYHKIP